MGVKTAFGKKKRVSANGEYTPKGRRVEAARKLCVRLWYISLFAWINVSPILRRCIKSRWTAFSSLVPSPPSLKIAVVDVLAHRRGYRALVRPLASRRGKTRVATLVACARPRCINVCPIFVSLPPPPLFPSLIFTRMRDGRADITPGPETGDRATMKFQAGDRVAGTRAQNHSRLRQIEGTELKRGGGSR